MTPTTDDVRADTEEDPFDPSLSLKAGAVAGAIATVVMGLAITLMDLETMRVAIAGLYGQAGNLAVGWIAHVVHGTLFGILFAVILADPGLYRLTHWRWKTTAFGVVYGLVLGVVGAGIVMPAWLAMVGIEQQTPTPPDVSLNSLVWHAIYGFMLGAVFPLVEDV
jgi:cytochrome c biogenesis protein CcdA